MQMIQVGERLFVGRHPNGGVRLLRFKQSPVIWPDVDLLISPADLDFDLDFDVDSWAAMITGVSRQGHEGGRFYAARAFHMNPKVDLSGMVPKAEERPNLNI